MSAPHGKFTLSDFQKQMRQIKKLGSVSSIMKMIPGMGTFADLMAEMKPDKDRQQIDGIINSMTHWERENPEAIDEDRRNRIARGSGAEPADVSKLLNDFLKMAPLMEKMAGMGMRDRLRPMNQLADNSLSPPTPKETPPSNAPPPTMEDAPHRRKPPANLPWWLLWERRLENPEWPDGA